ncbi:hypothetical protein EJ110_NYTH35686 [Nymphaea thermarum]|nr:hypothetical protein EJ110_NYTH35686 [Nymphaea thermarum]
MASSSSSTVNTDQTEIGAYRTENVPVQVTTIRLTKEDYFPRSTAMTMGIAGRGRIAYIDGRNPEPTKASGVWDTWFLEDNQMKTWIVNSVSADIQPLIIRKKTARDMWVILEQTLYVAKEWENRVFLFLAGLNDEFEGVRSQILNSGEVSNIEDVYSSVEAEEQRRLVTTEGKRDLMSYNERFALVSRGPGDEAGYQVEYLFDPNRALESIIECNNKALLLFSLYMRVNLFNTRARSSGRSESSGSRGTGKDRKKQGEDYGTHGSNSSDGGCWATLHRRSTPRLIVMAREGATATQATATQAMTRTQATTKLDGVARPGDVAPLSTHRNTQAGTSDLDSGEIWFRVNSTTRQRHWQGLDVHGRTHRQGRDVHNDITNLPPPRAQ